MPESFRGLRKFFCKLMLSRRIDKKYDLTTKRTKATKDSFFLMLSNFVFLVIFVVKNLFRVWLRLRCGRAFETFIHIVRPVPMMNDGQKLYASGASPTRSLWLDGRMIVLCVALLSGLISTAVSALEVPAAKIPVNDFAKMMPPASVDDLTERLRRVKTETAYTIAVLTLPSLQDEDIETFGRKAFENLPLTEKELQRSALLIVARKEQKVSLQTGSELRSLFPQPQANRKLQGQVEIYLNGMRPDLGIHAGVHYLIGVIRGDFRVEGASEEEKLEDASKRGAGAGAIFAVLLAPFLAFFVGMLWGVYATHYGVRRETRLFIGAVLAGGTAKIIATLTSTMGSYSDGLWYFILALSIPLGIFGSLTEYWMGGDWSGIPRVKDKVRRKPEDNMGI